MAYKDMSGGKWHTLFGFKNDENKLRDAQDFRDAAVADGWEMRPTYIHESTDRAATLTRDSFKMMTITRTYEGEKISCDASVNIWGPDHLAITVPDKYDWAKISAAVTKCLECGADGETHRAGFAGRYCPSCLPAQKKEQEYPGWTA